MKLVNEQDRLGLWAVDATGNAFRITNYTKLEGKPIRAVVSASSPADALNAANGEAFSVGVRNATPNEPAEIAIYGEIGDIWTASDANSVCQFLRANKGKAINVRINSPGGLAYDGITIHNALLNHDGPVTTTIEGLAGSAASIIAMAGQPAAIYENAQLFIHRAALVAIGNRDAMDEAMRWLDAIDEAIARTYKAKTGKALDKILEMMKGKVDGTVFSARDAVSEKFCNVVLSLKKNNGSNQAPSVSNKVCQPIKSVELARAIRMRSRNELFVPANSVVESPEKRPKPKAEASPMYDVGDRVTVSENGMDPFDGEVRASVLAYSYSVVDDSGVMHEGCCEDDLSLVNDGEQQ